MSSLDLSSSFSGLEKGASFGGGWLDGGDERTVVSAAGSSKAKEAVRRKTTTVAAKTYDPDLLWCVSQRASSVRSMLALTLESLAGVAGMCTARPTTCRASSRRTRVSERPLPHVHLSSLPFHG